MHESLVSSQALGPLMRRETIAGLNLTRSEVVNQLANDLFRAFEADTYPDENIEQIFGIRMSKTSGGPLELRPIGSLMYPAWQRLNVLGRIDQAGVEQAILSHGLPAYFQAKVQEVLRAAEEDTEEYFFGSPYAYFHEIARRGFDSIEWDRLLLQRMAGDYGPAAARPRSTPPAPPAPPPASADPAGLLGCRVVLHGLKGDVALNGAVADCASFDSRRGRYCVVVVVGAAPGQEGRGVAVKAENLRRNA